MNAIEWFPIATADKTAPEKVLLFQEGAYAIGRWIDESYERQESLGRKGNIEKYEWVRVEQGYWDADGDVYDPTHWAILTPP